MFLVVETRLTHKTGTDSIEYQTIVIYNIFERFQGHYAE
jgi:hypothetical protein